MAQIRVEGGRALAGRVVVGGNKNSALPLLAACLLTDEPCVLRNVPRIRDVEVLLDILRGLGATIERLDETSLRVRCGDVESDRPDPALVGKVRGSVLLLAPLLARKGAAHLAPPGGDFPSRRSIAIHLQALEAMGAVVLPGPSYALHAPGGLSGASVYLDEASVTGTETALLAAAGATGPSEIRHAAMEPHVIELCRFLRAMGVTVTGEGTPTIRVEPPSRLRGAAHTLDGDYIEAGSWAVLAAMTGGTMEIAGAAALHLEVVMAPLRKMGLRCDIDDARLVVEPSRLVAVPRITTGLWPGFPSDMISLVTVLATQAEGRTLVHDWLYELRLFALEQLSAMHGQLFLCDPHRIIVTGRSTLHGRGLDSRDLRSGMALIAAALAAEGESRIAPIETVERGYASLVERLTALGAAVERMD